MKKILRPLWRLYKFLVLRPAFAIKNTWLIWNLRNHRNISSQKSSPLPLSEFQKEILQGMESDGIYITSLDALFPNSDYLKKLQDYGNGLKKQAFRNPTKQYWIEMWDAKKFEVDLENPFMKFTLDPKIVSLANAYMKMYSKFHSISLSETIPVQPGTPASQSQQWHRDGGDKRYFKVFIYLNDIDKNDGAFEYVKGSQPGGKWENLFPQINLYSTPSRITDEAINVNVPKEDIITCTGKAGTLVFADTVGIHKGSYSTQGSRFASIITFYSPHPIQKAHNWKPSPKLHDQIAHLPKQIKFTLEN